MHINKYIIFFISLICIENVYAGNRYPLGPNDVLHIQVYDHPELTTDITVAENGSIHFPLIGSVYVQNQSTYQLEELLATKLAQGKFINTPSVNVNISKKVSNSVVIVGEVNKPGRYAISDSYNLIDLLADAGGVSPLAGNVIFIKDSKNTIKINLNDLLANKSIQINSDSQIVVPKAEYVYVYGEVQRPGAYKIEPNMTVIQAITLAGGFTPKASESSIRKEINNKFVDISKEQLVLNGDVINIAESIF